MKKLICNILSLSRIVAAVGLLLPQTFSIPFWILYGWCGVSDMIDGPLARKLGATSKTGAILDSVADLVFFAAACIKILPTISFPGWLWWCIGIIALAQVFNMTYCYFRLGGISALHNRVNRLFGLALFLLPIAIQIV